MTTRCAVATSSTRSPTASSRTTSGTAPAGRCGRPWRAPYDDLDASFVLYPRQYERFLYGFRFEEKERAASPSFLEQLAHAEALVATMNPPLSDYDMATLSRYGEMSMGRIWKSALFREETRIDLEDQKERLRQAETAACVQQQELDRKTTGYRHCRR